MVRSFSGRTPANYVYRNYLTNILATFLKLAGSALVQMFIGDGARLVRDAFALGLSFFLNKKFLENYDSLKISIVTG